MPPTPPPFDPLHVLAERFRAAIAAAFPTAGDADPLITGTKNPAIAAGEGVTVGPLTGTVAPGDSLEANGGSLNLTVIGINITCNAQGPQSPGPFVFE